MAKPVTYSKRDNEKKKQEKRVMKQKKKDERKASGKDSFEDMIAYVDENGLITSTPPEKREKNAPADNNAHSETTRTAQKPTAIKGRVEYLNDEKGYGFIKEIGKINKYFFHLSHVKDKIQTNDTVCFDVEYSKKGLNAVNIQIER